MKLGTKRIKGLKDLELIEDVNMRLTLLKNFVNKMA